MKLLVEKSPTDQLITGRGLLIMGVVVAPYVAGFLVAIVERMNQTELPYGRYFFVFGAAFFAALGAAKLAFFMAVKAGLIISPWGGSA